MNKKWDILIKNAILFDGNGGAPQNQNIGISAGKIDALGEDLDESDAEQVFDAQYHWVMPGLVDIHTHYDVELEIAPGLPESVRHGTTSVVISNCSLGLAFGAQRNGDDDPIVSCFARVENMPKHVLKKAADKVYWNSSAEYLVHLETLNLGPNVAPMIPHSMLRIEVMGLDESVSRRPSASELEKMTMLLKKGMDEGYVGFSTDALPFHFLANDPHREKQIPTQFAPYDELKTLTSVVRDHDRVWQATPPKDNPLEVIRNFLLTSGRLHKKPLKTTVVAALDVTSNGSIVKLARTLSRVLNTRLCNGRFHMQALAAPFKIWSDGPINPLFEEIDAIRPLIEVDLEDRAGRRKILDDPAFQKRFKKMWMSGKTGFSIDRLKRLFRREAYAFNRTLGDMRIEICPIKTWEGKTFQDVFDALLAGEKGRDKSDNTIIEEYFSNLRDESDFVLGTLRAFDTKLVWSTTSANRNPAKTRDLVMDPALLPGFNDSGAHLTNMAFYDGNLRALKLSQEGGDLRVSYMVKRLTKDPSDIFGLSAGVIAPGKPADIAIINPKSLEQYDPEANVERIFREELGHEQLVNRSDGVVSATLIGGKFAWQGDSFSKDLGTKKLGRVLLAQ